MARVLVVYASKHGSTETVALAIAVELRNAGHTVHVRGARIARDVQCYDAVVVGGSLYLGRWHADARRFLSRNAEQLATKQLAVFALGPRTLDEHDVAESRTQLDDALERTTVTPATVTIFGGVIDPEQLHFPLSRMPKSDVRDWDAIRAWAHHLEQLITAHSDVAAVGR